MGKEDREWYRDFWRQKNDVSHIYNPKQFRGQRSRAPGPARFPLILRIAVQLLAVYGALQLFKNHILPML